MTATMNGPMMSISGATTEALAEAREAILAIVAAPCGDTVKAAALDALKALCAAPIHTTISNCAFNGPASSETFHYANPEADESDESDEADEADEAGEID